MLKNSRIQWSFLSALVIGLLWSMLQSNTAVFHPQPLRAAPDATLDLSLELFAEGFSLPTAVANSGVPGDTRLFVAQQGGQIRVVSDDGTILATDFLNISSKVSLFGENGLLGLAFDPDYANNGYFYIYYTQKDDRNNYLARYQVSAIDPNVADASSEVILLTIIEPHDGHNGGEIAFGPDGYLYVGVGDGGHAEGGEPPPFDPQDLSSLLGKILRLDVSQSGIHTPDCGSAFYTIPDDNPFRDGTGGQCDEVWAYGLRNPWRFSFDRLTGDLYIADVGESAREEVNQQPAGDGGGQNYGWPCYEGSEQHHAPYCQAIPYIFPIFEYAHGTPDNHCSVTGGYVYRGGQFPVMQGHYLLADFCSGFIWSLNPDGNSWETHAYGALSVLPTTFGEDINGELYLAELLPPGKLYHIVENTTEFPILNISKSGPAESIANAPITYTLTVQNSGSGTAENLVITDTLPVGASYQGSSDGGQLLNGVVSWNVSSLPAQSEVMVSFAVTATQTITNSDYGVSADGGVGDLGDTAVTTTILSPLTIQKEGPATVGSGEAISYTLTVRNLGPIPLTNIYITDTVPISTTFLQATDSGMVFDGLVSWNLAPLAPNSEVSVGLMVTPTLATESPLVVRNEFYGVTADGGYSAIGTFPILTIVNGKELFLPFINKP